MTFHLQQMQNYAVCVILHIPRSSNMTTHLKSLHWLLVKVASIYKIACLFYHCHYSTARSQICCRKSHHTLATPAPAQVPCLSSIYLHTVRLHSLRLTPCLSSIDLHTEVTLPPAHTPCLSSIDLHTVRLHSLQLTHHAFPQ